MRIGTALCGGGWLLLAACGGGSSSPGGVDNTIFAGTVTVQAVGTAGATCANTIPVTYRATGVTPQGPQIDLGDCLDFVNADTAPHQPRSSGTVLCPELDSEVNAPALIPGGGHRTTPPFNTARACLWEDALNPVPTGGGGGH